MALTQPYSSAGVRLSWGLMGNKKPAPSRFNRDRSALVLDMDYWGVAYLRPFQQHDLSKTGDSEKVQILVEYALVAKQQAASGVVADLTTP